VSAVLVTGASGFVGRPLLESLLGAGEEVHALSSRPAPRPAAGGVHWHQVDLLDPASVERVIADTRPERLVHLAWYMAHGRFWSGLENVQWVEASLRLLRDFAEAGGRRALIVGSCAEYAWGAEHDLRELDSPLVPASLYGVCKDALRRVAAAYAREAGFELAWGRLFFLYGPREQSERLVPAVIRSLLAGERVATTTGGQVRDFMHVEDAAAALVALLLGDVTGSVNIASGRALSVAEVLDLIGSLTGGEQLIDRGARPTPSGEPPRIVASVERLEREVGFRPRVSLREGLAATVQWWREQAPATPPPAR
jgi:nucleoside-diphosphate-sugar epimerase